jgi:hypothetical protein
MKTIGLFAAIAIATAIPAAAQALTLSYTLTGPAGGYSASWDLPASGQPDSFVEDQGFAFERVSGFFPGSTQNEAYLDFFSAANEGGLTISDADGPDILVSLMGAQLYTGGEGAPTFIPGTYLMTDTEGRSGYTLTVISAAGAVPELGTWGLMILGMGATGGALRGRNHRTRVHFA